ncbi:MAG: SDR family NAD(P)-dependent oxidoreductase, partial [Burkholderiales bacterium]
MTQHLYILTGGSRGMGLAIAEQLLTPGHTLICISRNQQASLIELAQKSGATLAQWSHDLADGAAASKALLTWLQAQKPNEFQSATLINNAGVIPRIGPLSEADPHNLAMALRV